MILTEVQINKMSIGAPEFLLLDEKRKAEFAKESTFGDFGEFSFSPQGYQLSNYLISFSSRPIGLASSCLHKDFPCMEITKFYVDREHRGVGYGDRLIDTIEQEALEQNIERVCVNLANCQPEVDDLFNKRGYQVIPNSEFGENMKAVMLMEKIL